MGRVTFAPAFPVTFAVSDPLQEFGGGGGGVSCAYPLDDDGTIAGAFGQDYAGPAVGADSQSMDYTTTSANNALLAPAGLFSTARFDRPASNGAAVEIEFTAGTSTGGGYIILTDAGGSFLNSGAVIGAVAGDLIIFRVASDGTVSATLNGGAQAIAWTDSTPGADVVGATDKYSYALGLNPAGAGETAQITLRTVATSYTGSHVAGDTDPCGNTIGA